MQSTATSVSILHSSVNGPPQQPTRLSSDGRILWQDKNIGQLRDGVYSKVVRDPAEWSSKYDAPGFQADAVEALWPRITGFEVRQRYLNRTIRWSRDAFRRNMVEAVLHPSYGRQFFPSLDDAEISDSSGQQLGLGI